MLTGIDIRNYRLFKELELSSLKRINLIAGMNNSGKTSLLEAIFFAALGSDPDAATNGNVTRTADLNFSNPQTRSSFMIEPYWRLLFHNLRTDWPISITLVDPVLGTFNVSAALTEPPLKGERSAVEAVSRASNTASHPRAFVISHQGPDGASRQVWAVERGDTLSIDSDEGPEVRYPRSVGILRPVSRLESDASSELARMRIAHETDSLLSALQVIEPRLIAVEENSASGIPTIWGDIGLPELIPLHVMGGGLSRIASIMLRMRLVRGGLLLIDEFESGFHHSVLKNVWQAIDKAAERLDVQVFATTHSYECIEAAAAGVHEEHLRLHRIDRLPEAVRAVTFDPDQLNSALEIGFEVR